MADFKQAIEEMNKGKVTKLGSNKYWINEGSGGLIETDALKSLDYYDYISKEWKILDNEDNWNLVDGRSCSEKSLYMIYFSTISTLKEKLLEDFGRYYSGESVDLSLDEIESILNKRFGF